MIQKTHRDTKIALCRKCGGTGYVLDGVTGRRILCPQCQGSGRVLVSGDIMMDIRPYKSEV